ncbi:flagellar motor control protein ZomB [Mycobacterium sp. BK086]|uniref:flagellar motor control protein ZomB n=1 Tax=Mycobacterium sp. BK086 TaxID=2512165 RepID=UPI0025711ACA|nr:flagellar motor control protein ZomB [Mycobacterium sp. BK086]
MKLPWAPAFPLRPLARVSLWLSVVVVGALWAWGAWQRRWIADDGLIVLRTVRNLLAGNGPVFNAGERVESNTSTLWTFLNYFGALVGGPVRLEYVALALALGLSIAGVVLVMIGTARLFAPGLQGRRALLLPAGALVYIAIPPARDFATSGLENGLVLAWLGLLWWMMVAWSQAPRRHGSGPLFTASLAFVAGLSVLVRPELALVGGLALVMMLVAARGWRDRVLIVVAGGLFPVGYQIFRMGYYGLLFPQTALAKDASGDKWAQGLIYLTNFNQPYALWLAAVLVIALGVVLVAARGTDGAAPIAGNAGRLASRIQTPTAVVIFMLVSGLVQGLYWIRQGGDFMHGRVLLTPVFCLLTPIAVIPIALPASVGSARDRSVVLAGASAALWLGIVGWSLWAANSPGMGLDATRVTYSGIVDERRFYSQATGHAHPLTAADYLDYPRMRAVLTAINNTPDGALLLPSGNYDQWDVVPAYPPPPPPPGVSMDTWRREIAPHTVFFTNLGMLGMNVGLNVRVIDQIGLANPIAAHTARLEDGRIGHDKNLFPDWAVAEGPWLKEHPYVPPYLDEGWITEAGVALGCPETDAMLNSIRGPLGIRRFVSNVMHALEFTRYRIDRVPQYELARCNLPEPPLKGTPYTGLPATGP